MSSQDQPAGDLRNAARPSTKAALSRQLAANETGATAIEYALIAAGIGAAVAAAVWSLGSTTLNLYQSVANLF